MRFQSLRTPPAIRIAALATVLLTAVPVEAQGSRSLSALGRRMDEFTKQSEKLARDQMQSEMRGRRLTKEDLRKIEQIKAETREDLESLQSSYNEIATALNAKAAVTPAFATQAAEKINKSASRLRANVILPKPKESVSIRESNLLLELKTLCHSIYGFLTNPIIENPSVLDADSANKAGELLGAILAVSERLKQKPN